MPEYIEREEAMFRLSKWLEKASDTNNRGLYNFGEIAAYQTSIVEINSMPAADIKPVARGKWRFEKGDGKTCVDGWVCTACNCGFHTNVPYFDEFRFCPNCGADMRGEKDDKTENP